MAKQIWSDSHGKQHKTKKDAEFMDSMYSAADGLEVARKKIHKLLAGKAVTADGVPLTELSSGDYYRVVERWGSRPWFARVWVWPHDAYLDVEDKQLVLVVEEYRDAKRETMRIPMNEIYASEKKAKAAWFAAWERWLDEERQELEKQKGGG